MKCRQLQSFRAMRFLLLIPASAILLAAAGPELFDAARNNQVAILKPYLESKGDPNARDEGGHTLLILAAYNGQKDAVDLLLKYGADVNSQDRMGTPLMAACFKGDKAIVDRLLKAGARVNDRNGIGATALMFAALTAQFEVVQVLRKHSADVDVVDERGLTARKLAEQQGNDEMVKVLENHRTAGRAAR